MINDIRMTRLRRAMNKKVTPIQQPSFGLIDALSPLYYGTKLIGLSPYKRVDKHYKISLKGSLITLLVAVLFIVNAISIAEYLQYYSNNIIIMITVRFRLGLILVSTVIIYLNEIRIQNRMFELITELQNIDNIFMSMGIVVPYKKMKYCSLLSLIFMYSVCFIAVIDYEGNWDNRTAEKLKLLVVIMIPLITQGAITTIFCFFIMIVKQRYEILNNQLLGRVLNMANERNDVTENNKSYFLRNKPPQIITQAKSIHYELCKIVRKVNNMYGLPITCTIFISYCTIFAQIYYWYVIFKNEVDVFGSVVVAHTIIIVFFTISCVVSITFICDGCVSQGKQTAIELFKINYSYANMEITNVVLPFVLQVLSMPTDLTAIKMFVINRRLLLTIFASTVTYSIILIQFDIANTSN